MACNYMKYLIKSMYLRRICVLIFLFSALSVNANEARDWQKTAQSIIHSLDYVSVDYPGVIEQGQVVNQEEYQEQLEITAHAVSLVSVLPDNPQKAELAQKVAAIQLSVQQRIPGEKVVDACRAAITTLINAYQVNISPAATPSLTQGQQLFQANCVSCHGKIFLYRYRYQGRERQQHRSILSLYNSISLGVTGTAMPAFNHLDPLQRWSLAFYVSHFYNSPNEVARGAVVYAQSDQRNTLDNPVFAFRFLPLGNYPRNFLRGIGKKFIKVDFKI